MSDYDAEPLPDEEVVANANEVEEESVSDVVEQPTEDLEEESAAAEESVSTQEVVQNVQEMLTTEPAVSSEPASLEERVKMLEERLEIVINLLKKSNVMPKNMLN